MACSRLTTKAQEAALFAVSLAFAARFEHDVVLLIFIFIAWQFVRSLSIRTKESGFSLTSFVFPDTFEQVFTRWLFINSFYCNTQLVLYTFVLMMMLQKNRKFYWFLLILFVYLNIRLIIRWVFSDCHLCYYIKMVSW